MRPFEVHRITDAWGSNTEEPKTEVVNMKMKAVIKWQEWGPLDGRYRPDVIDTQRSTVHLQWTGQGNQTSRLKRSVVYTA